MYFGSDVPVSTHIHFESSGIEINSIWIFREDNISYKESQNHLIVNILMKSGYKVQERKYNSLSPLSLSLHHCKLNISICVLCRLMDIIIGY